MECIIYMDMKYYKKIEYRPASNALIERVTAPWGGRGARNPDYDRVLASAEASRPRPACYCGFLCQCERSEAIQSNVFVEEAIRLHLLDCHGSNEPRKD